MARGTLFEANSLCSVSREKVNPWLYMIIISRDFSFFLKVKIKETGITLLGD